MVFGYVFAVLAAVASGSGAILESLGIRRAGAYGGRTTDLVALRHQWVYFLGLGVELLGFVCAARALHELPLFLVQSVLAFSVGVTATISAFMGTRLATRGWIALGVGAVGLVLLGVSALPGPARALPAVWQWMLLGMAVPVAAIAFYTRRHSTHWGAVAMAFGAGLALGVVGVSARTLELSGSVWQLLLEPSAWAIVLNGLAAVVVFAMALQQGGATAVLAITFTTNTTLSSLVGLLYLDDQVRSGFITAMIVGLVLAITGAIGTAHYAAAPKPREPFSVS